MYRLIASASFIRAGISFGTRRDAPVLSVEDAWDVAAYIQRQRRPEQHTYGPFKPFLDAQKAVSASSN